MNIPILIICYNNYKYVENTLFQIKKINKEYYNNIQIVNNNSTCIDTIHFLNHLDVPVIHTENRGPWISTECNKHIYDSLPDKFILTDPDLKLNEHIPSNFIDILSKLSDTYECCKIGCALDISDYDKMYTTYYTNYTIYSWEIQNWQQKINNSEYELYDAGIDTTFCLVNKKYTTKSIRVAGNFIAKHLPWYIDNEIYTVYENYLQSTKTTAISSIASTIKNYIETHFLKIYKKNEFFFIPHHDCNIDFWKNVYSTWNNPTFNVLDTYLSPSNIFIDIGGCIGTTMYGARKSKHAYSFHLDKNSVDLSTLKTNCNNYTVITDTTLEKLIQQISISDISLIHVDIKGTEEHLLQELLYIHTTYHIPLYIHFYYSNWIDKQLDRFDLPDNVKDQIVSNPNIFILFCHNYTHNRTIVADIQCFV
jgi:hypothetical protein